MAGSDIKVHVFPYELKPDESLVDGKDTPIKVDDTAILIWADLQPGARFVHPSWYILVSRKTRVVAGEWWPVINGRQFYSYDVHNTVGVMNPLVLEMLDVGSPSPSTKPESIKVHMHPYLVKAGDTIVDGPAEDAAKISVTDDSLFVWVDLEPGNRFEHPTTYIVISANDDPPILRDGKWWPVLNGDRLFEHRNQAVFMSPFILTKG